MPSDARTASAPPTETLRTRVAAAKAAVGWNGEGGRVVVGEGQTLYNLSKRFGIPVSAIMAANGIADPTTVRVGQILVIPRYTYDQTASVSAPDADPNVRAATGGRGMIGEVDRANVPAPAASRAAARLAPIASPSSVPSAGTVTVAAGDTLYSIARRAGSSLNALREANGLSDDSIRIGQVLRLPGGGFESPTSSVPVVPVVARSAPIEPARTVEPAPTAMMATAPEAPALPRTSAPAAPTATPDPITTASISPTPPVSSSGMRWPVNGRVVRQFGGAQKGIDIAVPSGTAVRAAEGGTVIYAGSGLKELGRTVLIQHPDGLVTVYGHADALQVAKGQKVQRGDVIASSGMSGDAETPRVHFQVRKGSTPVDPDSYLN